MTVAGTIGNGVMIIAFLRRRDLRTIQNWFNLATFVSGFLMCFIICPLQYYINLTVFVPNPRCALLLFFNITLSLFFTLTVLALTIERYISICHSLTSQSILTARRVGVGLAGLVIFSFVVGFFLPIATPLGYKGSIEPGDHCRLSTVIRTSSLYLRLMGLGVIVPIPAMLLIYFRIFFVLRRHIRAVVALSSIPRTIHFNDNPVATENRKLRKRWTRETKSALFLLVVILSFAVPWASNFLVGMHINLSTQLNPFVYVLSHGMLFFSTAINPYLYGFGNKLFRHAVMSVFCERCKRRNQHLITIHSTSIRLNDNRERNYSGDQCLPPTQE